MPDNGDDGLSSDELIRRAREELDQTEEESPISEGPAEVPVEDEESLSAPVEDQSIEEPVEAVVQNGDAASGSRDSGTPTPPILPSTPPTPPSGPQEVAWYRRGWVRGLGAGAVALGIFLSNSGVFDPPLEDQFLDGFAEGAKEAGFSESSWECIEEGLRADGYVDELAELDESDFDQLDDLSVSSPASDYPPELEHFMEGFFFYAVDPSVGCLSPSEIDALAVDFSDPESVALVELLTPGCENGSLADCDMLYWVTDPGSSAENVGLTCGGRNEPLDPNVTNCIINYQSESDLQVLVDECGGGFYLACDVLYVVSVVGSDEETLAESCGGQREPEYVLPCNASYGYGTRNTSLVIPVEIPIVEGSGVVRMRISLREFETIRFNFTAWGVEATPLGDIPATGEIEISTVDDDWRIDGSVHCVRDLSPFSDSLGYVEGVWEVRFITTQSSTPFLPVGKYATFYVKDDPTGDSAFMVDASISWDDTTCGPRGQVELQSLLEGDIEVRR